MKNKLFKMNNWLIPPLFLLLAASSALTNTNNAQFHPCSEISREFRFPCLCSLGPVEPALDNNPAISVNCDRVVFPSDVPALPPGAPITSFRQRHAGHQALPAHLFSPAAGLPLRSVDLSGNSLRRLTERLLHGLHASLIELRLADNLLGDTLNPIFSTSEFRGLGHLQVLDLSGNVIKAVEEGMLEGCRSLKELYLDRNSLGAVPSTSLNGPKSLRVLSLVSNRIGTIKTGAFQAQPNLEQININSNLLHTIEASSFSTLPNLKSLHLSHNRLTRFNSDVFQGAESLQHLDISQNFITEFPSIALKAFTSLKHLNLSSNIIQNLDNNDLQHLTSLYHLDLSRNSIANLVPGTFLGLRQLRRLDISVNSLRTIEDDAFEGLDNLEHLNIKDNNVLLIPASALGRLPKLTTLQLDYNRVAALSGEILRSIAEKVTKLVLAKNVVRELPPASFQYFKQLHFLDLTRNLITNLNTDAFQGLETSLTELYLGQNRIASLQGQPLSLSALQVLDLSENHLSEFPRNAFSSLHALKVLNLSSNTHLNNIPSNLIHKLGNLQELDMSSTGLKLLTSDFFSQSYELRKVHLQNNALTEITEGVFVNLPNLTFIDLSYNAITNIKQSSFVNIMNIKQLNLANNKLSSFKGEFFNTGTSLEELDISHNELSYLFPSSFRIHPRLKKLQASHNKFNFFPAELIATLQYLEEVDLSFNELKSVEELDFARLPRLRSLFLAGNKLESLSEMAFHNSTQLQVVDLSFNKLERLGERTFEGLVRLELLDLAGNRLVDLPETIFERARLQMLENINLSGNLFEVAPLRALQRQYFFVSSVDLSRNRLAEIPGDDSIMVNIKKLDLSFNPLSEQSILNILGEPKTLRELNLAGTGIEDVTQLETPFLTHLNLSSNKIQHLDEKIFERTTLLETLDLSSNKIKDINNFSKIWNVLKSLQALNLSSNPIESISAGAFSGLDTLRELFISSLTHCERVEKTAFKSVPNLKNLQAFDYPRLGYIDLHGLLLNLQSLESVDIETKDSAVGSDQLQSVLHPRLKELGLRGARLRSISPGTLSGLKNEQVSLRFVNTSLTSLPPALFFPVPRSSRIILDVAGSQLTSLSPQILQAFDDRRGDLRLIGLDSNPVLCDCNARALRRWLPSSQMTALKCSSPEDLSGRLLVEIGDDELSCEPRKIISTAPPFSSSLPTSSRNTQRLIPKKTTLEPEIIWSVADAPSTTEKAKVIGTSQSTLNNDDTLIIGIVGGVVAFIAILIIIICIIRLRMSGGGGGMSQQQQQHNAMMQHLAGGGGVVGGTGGSSCACSVKGGSVGAGLAVPGIYPIGYGAGGYAAATLPHKMQVGGGGGMRPGSNYSTMGRVPYYGGQQAGGGQQQQPYFIAFPAGGEENKIYR